MSINCDVLVIGGGPAGSSAARSAALHGAKTIIIEKKSKITEISCAEGIGTYLFPLLPFRIPKNQLIWKIDGMIFSDGSTEIFQKGTFYKGWSLDRENFDNWLLKEAKKANAKVMLNSELIDLKISSNYKVNEITVKNKEKKLLINPTFIVAADGAESTVASKLGVEKKSNFLANVHSWEMKNLSLNNPHMEHLF